jgi:putative heme-binding domain-containing protein
MNKKYRARWMFSLGSMVYLTAAIVAKAQSAPDGKGKAEFQRICSNCHSVSMATSQRMTPSEWSGVVNDMVSRGAQGTQDELDNVVAYLAENFGKDKPPAINGAPTQASTPVVEPNEPPLSEAEVSKAEGLLKSNACLSCHRMSETGSYLGPDLTDIGGRRSSQQLRNSLVSPGKEVLPESRSVRVVKQDGKAVTGRLLNQDAFSVQLIDSSGQLMSLQKSSLRELAILDQNPMPSYANKMSAQDLTDLVNWLSSLKGTGKP